MRGGRPGGPAARSRDRLLAARELPRRVALSVPDRLGLQPLAPLVDACELAERAALALRLFPALRLPLEEVAREEDAQAAEALAAAASTEV